MNNLFKQIFVVNKFEPKNNRKRTRGRNYKFVTDKESGKTHKIWINFNY